MKISPYERIEQGIYFLLESRSAQPTLEDLSQFLDLSPYHCHRLFKKWAGITPKDFLQFVTLVKAKALLENQTSLMEVSLDLGFSSSSRLHDLFITHEAMTPGEYKSAGRNLEIKWGQFETPAGEIILGVTKRGICFLGFKTSEAPGEELIRERWPCAEVKKDEKALGPWHESIVARMLGQKSCSLKILFSGTSFQIKVWESLLRLPEGMVTSYQAIANVIGLPKAARAVGAALGANPIGYLIPCHRVLSSSGALHQYHWGVARKVALLSLERRGKV
ncbi:MAG: methylated-DNA--[protein]-cysteine S-methyltransferase [Bdellovibrionales bacterium]|nr:methylated-DNA--[protein]-cysteine S-methyltransferase [Bdellovibrionales bacterium]